MLDAIAELEAWLREQEEEARREEERRKIQAEIDKYVSLKGSAASLIGAASAAIGALESSLSGCCCDCELEAGELKGEIAVGYGSTFEAASGGGGGACAGYASMLGNAESALGQIDAKIADLQSQYDAV